MSAYYVHKEEGVQGPYSKEELKNAIDSETLAAHDLIHQEGSEETQTIEKNFPHWFNKNLNLFKSPDKIDVTTGKTPPPFKMSSRALTPSQYKYLLKHEILSEAQTKHVDPKEARKLILQHKRQQTLKKLIFLFLGIIIVTFLVIGTSFFYENDHLRREIIDIVEYLKFIIFE